MGAVALIFVLRLTLDPFGSRFWWVLAFAVIALAAFTARPDRRLDRLGRGRCGHCDYDLRGTRGRCPECGKLVPPGTPIRRE
jgi:hypothetical protein